MMASAASLGLCACATCRLVSRPVTANSICPRCGSTLHFRKPGSIGRTWALLIAAMVLYVPANTLPIMLTRSLFNAQDDTIISGVIFLWQDGAWYLALIVFIASIVVPLAKIIGLAVLLASVQLGLDWPPEQRARLYRLIEAIGRWSMLDIFVVGLLVMVVQLTALASVRAGPAATAFGAVVVLTMAAAQSFDPRLIWDPVKQPRGRQVTT